MICCHFNYIQSYMFFNLVFTEKAILINHALKGLGIHFFMKVNFFKSIIFGLLVDSSQ